MPPTLRPNGNVVRYLAGVVPVAAITANLISALEENLCVPDAVMRMLANRFLTAHYRS